jgi:transposase InsO family protein
VARGLRNWLAATGAKTLYIEPGSPWENGYCESFNSKLRDEFLNGEIFYTLKDGRADPCSNVDITERRIDKMIKGLRTQSG